MFTKKEKVNKKLRIFKIKVKKIVDLFSYSKKVKLISLTSIALLAIIMFFVRNK